MSVADLVRKLREKRNEDKSIFKEMQRERRLQQMVIDREKSANERELEKRMKLKREEGIKRQLDVMRNEDKRMNRHNMFLNQKNIFKGQASIMKNNEKLFPMKKGHTSSMGFMAKGNMIR